MNGYGLRWLLGGMLLIAGPAGAQPYRFVPFDVSCDAGAAACPTGLVPGATAIQTSARGINARGDVVGFYVDTSGAQHGFLLQNGKYTTLDVSFPGVRATVANGINARGEIVGQYLLPVNPDAPQDSPVYCPADLSPNNPDPACIKGFYYRNGEYTTIMFPGHPGAIAQRITSDGEIFGCLHDHNLTTSMFGAAWQRSVGAKDVIAVQGAFSLTSKGGELSDPMPVPMSMNNGGTPGGAQRVAGFLMDMNNVQHGYLVQNGMLETYDPTLDTNLTAIWDMDPGEDFVGTYRKRGEPAPKRHGFFQPADGSAPQTLDVSFVDEAGTTITAFATIAFGINPSGLIVGQYTLVANGATHGFLAIPPDRH